MRLTTAAMLSFLATSALASPAHANLPIINDDFARARAEAAKRHLPLFVEVWAPW